MRVNRWDASPLEKFERTPSGGLRIPATPARIGVQTYRNPDGSERRELRLPEEVFHADALASYRGAAVTDLHPSARQDGPAAVTPENWRQLAIGHIGEQVSHNDTHVTCDVLLQDAQAIALVESGRRKELSAGYTADLDPTPGEWNGQPYDGIQRNIRINHVALLPPGMGRAGESAALRLDAWDHKEENMPPVKIVLDGKEVEKGSDEHIAWVEAQAKARIDAQEKALAQEKARADAAERAAKELPAKLAKRQAFRALISDAKGFALRHGARWDAAEPPAEGEGDEGGFILGALKALAPDFNLGTAQTAEEGALMMLISLMKKEESAEGDGQPVVGDNMAADPGNANPPPPPAEAGRADARDLAGLSPRERLIRRTERAYLNGSNNGAH